MSSMEIAASLFKRTVWSALFLSERIRFKMGGGQRSVEIPAMSFPRKRFGKLRLRRVLARLTKFEEEGSGGQVDTPLPEGKGILCFASSWLNVRV